MGGGDAAAVGIGSFTRMPSQDTSSGGGNKSVLDDVIPGSMAHLEDPSRRWGL